MKDLSSLLVEQHQVNNVLFKNQLSLMGLDEMAVYIRFNNGHALLLSTCQTLMTSQKIKIDSNEKFLNSSGRDVVKNYYLGEEIAHFHPELDYLLGGDVSLSCIYCLPRLCAECEFVFSGLSYQASKESARIYARTVRNFELFCIRYIRAFGQLITSIEPAYRYAVVFNNEAYLKRVIKITDKAVNILTPKEKECLSLSLKGKSYKEIARDMDISDLTVKRHYQNIREKLECDSITEALVMSLYLGEIGCLLSVPPCIN